jgi:hypothetical protein
MKLFLLFGLATLPVLAQLGQGIDNVTSDPTAGGACVVGRAMQLNIAASPPHLWACGPGGWTQQAGALTGSASLTFPSLNDGTCGSQTFAVTGISTGASIAGGSPSTLQAGLLSMAFVSASNTVQVRVCNLSGAAVTPPVATWGMASIAGLTSASASLTFGLVGDLTCSAQTFALSSANVGNSVVPQWPSALPANFYGSMYVFATGTITVGLCNFSGGPVTVSALTYGAALLR